jgi:hypothetical protein
MCSENAQYNAGRKEKEDNMNTNNQQARLKAKKEG